MIYNDPFVESWWSWMDVSWFFKRPATLSPFPLCKCLIQQKLCGHRTWPMVFEWHLMTTDMSGEELLQVLERESYDASLGLYFERHKTHKVGLMNLVTWRFWKVHWFCVRHRRRRNFGWVVFPTPSFPVAKLGWIVGNANVHSAWKELKKNEKEDAEKSIFPFWYRKFDCFLGWYPKWPCNF